MIPVKLIAIVLVTSAVLVALRSAYTAAYESGWNAAQLEMSRDFQARMEREIALEKAQWEKVTEVANDGMIQELEIVEVERIVERKIPTIVERVVRVTPDCSNLGDDVLGLLNEQVGGLRAETRGN